MPAFTTEFFRPSLLGNARNLTFEDVLTQIMALNLRQRIRAGDDPAVILTLNQNHSEYAGEAARIRMEDLPSIIDSTTGSRHDLNVANNEGLGEEIYFLYDAGLNVIAVQVKGHFRPGALAHLIGDLANTDVDFQVILREDAFQRFQNLDLITKVNFTLARPRQIRGLAPSVMGAIREIDEFNGVSAKIEVNVGRERNISLNRNAVSRLLGERNGIGESLKELSITGTTRRAGELEGRTHLDVVDFINDRLLERSEVEGRGRSKRLDPDGCRMALRSAISTHEEYLRTYRG
jgi:hypothetical protein